MRARRLVLSVLVVLVVPAVMIMAGRTLFPPPPDQPTSLAIAPFALVDPGGRVVTERPTEGRWRLVLFGQAGCADACMEALTEVADALDELGPDVARLEPLFVTTDPARDTAEELETFAATFDGRIVPLTGSAAQVEQALRAFHIGLEPTGRSEGVSRRSTAAAFLVDPAGHLVRLFQPGTPGPLMAQVLRQLMQPANPA